jgi:hypothetical protein
LAAAAKNAWKKTPAEAGATPGWESGEIDRPVNTAR